MRIAVAPGDDLVARVRAAGDESVVLVLDPTHDPLAMAQAVAAIGPLAMARAPTGRVNAVTPAAGAAPADVDAAVSFLDSAVSTTGQVIAVA